jgi:hypothetical protein
VMFPAVYGRYMSIRSKTVLNRTEKINEVCEESCREGRTHNPTSLVSMFQKYPPFMNNISGRIRPPVGYWAVETKYIGKGQ